MVAGARDERTRVVEKAMELLQVVRERESPTSRSDVMTALGQREAVATSSEETAND
jgi:hypothetical protein